MRRSLNRAVLVTLAALCLESPPSPTSIQLIAAVAPATVNELSANPSHAPGVAPATTATPALDEMLIDATGRRQHWPSIPRLVVLTSVMTYHAGESSSYAATAERMSAQDAEDLANELTAALRVLTAGAFDRFAGVEFEAVAEGSSVTIARPNHIVAGRFDGVRRLANTIGFGGRRALRDGAIVSGAVVLDSEFDRDNARRRLLRTHELGHALGFNHVKSRVSIMNPSIGSDMTDLDRDISLLAFQRPAAGRTK